MTTCSLLLTFLASILVGSCSEYFVSSNDFEILIGEDGIPRLFLLSAFNPLTSKEQLAPTQGSRCLTLSYVPSNSCPWTVRLVDGVRFRANAKKDSSHCCVILPNDSVSASIPWDYLEGPLVEEVAHKGGTCSVHQDCLKVGARVEWNGDFSGFVGGEGDDTACSAKMQLCRQ